MFRTSTSALERSAAIDTGTTLIGAPTAAVEAIWGSVPGAQALTGQMAVFWSFRTYFHCRPFSLGVFRRQEVLLGGSDPFVLSHSVYHKLNVSMSFGGPSWPISEADLRLDTNTDGVCLCHFDIQPGTDIIGSGVPSWIVGDTFLVRFIC